MVGLILMASNSDMDRKFRSLTMFVACMCSQVFTFFRIEKCVVITINVGKKEYEANARINTHMSFLRLVNLQAPCSENRGNRVLFSIESHHIRQRKKEKNDM